MKTKLSFAQWLVVIFLLFPVAMYLMAKDFWNATRNIEIREEK